MSTQRNVAIDIARVDWFDTFFTRTAGQTADEILDEIGSLDVEVDSMEETGDLAEMAMSGWAYWTLYIKGYLDYSARKVVASDNVYLRYLVGYFGPRGHDPGLQDVLIDTDAALSRVTLRYWDFDIFRTQRPIGRDVPAVDPVVLTIVDPTPDHAKVLYDARTRQALPPVVVDGYHRIFLAGLFRVPELQAKISFGAEPNQLE